jgi:hypothetical protein
MTGNVTITAQPGTLTASVVPTVTRVWANTSYTFTITTSNPLTSTAVIMLSLPTTVTPSFTSPSCAGLIGTGLGSAPQCTYNSASNYILISNINGSTSNIVPQTFTLTIIGITNPGDTSTSGSFTITTHYTNDLAGQVDRGVAAGVTCTVGTISINTVSVVPSSYQAMQSSLSYTFNFNNTYLIPTAGTVTLQIPTDITINTASLPNYCKYSLNSTNYVSTPCSSTTNSTAYLVTFPSIASATIPPGTIISLMIAAPLCTNPTNTRVVAPFAITTYSSTATIETLSSGITLQMTTPANFQSFTVNRNAQQNSVTTSYTFTLKQLASLPSGSLLLITLPSTITLTSASLCTDLNGLPLTCTQNSFQGLTVTLPAVASSVQFGVIVTLIRNPASYRPTSGNFTALTQTGDQVSSYASGNFSTPIINSLPSIFTSLTYTFSPGSFGDPQTLVLTITPSQYITATYMLVSLASSFTINTLSCGSLIGVTGSCSVVSGVSGQLNLTGTFGFS